MTDNIVTSPNSRGISGITLGGGEKRTATRVTRQLSDFPGSENAKFVRLGKRRAGCVVNNLVLRVRLRRPNSEGEQSARDVVKIWKLANAQDAENLLSMQEREYLTSGNSLDAGDSDSD